MGFPLDQLSQQRLIGVHPDLVKVVMDCTANGLMPFVFGVSEGLRTLQQQKIDVAAGKSQIMNSRHLDGHAVDLVPLVNGQITWAWPPFYVLADQMRAAAMRTDISLIWGGCWDIKVADWTMGAMKQSADYVMRGGHFLDGPHFELPRDIYPSDAAPPAAATVPILA